MNIVFCGSSDFSLEVLKGLVAGGASPEMVITTPDRPKGRGYGLKPTPVKEYCRKFSFDCLSPESLTDEDFISSLKEREADLIVVASYGKILPPEMLAAAKIMPLGIHPSLLPAYRGAAPIQRALMHGEKETGVSLFRIVDKLDAGPLLMQKKVQISDKDDFFTLTEKLEKVSVGSFLESLDLIFSGSFKLIPQDESGASYAGKIGKEEGRIDWQRSAEEIVNLVRALREWPVAYTTYNLKRVQILEAEVADRDTAGTPGRIVDKGGDSFSVSAGKGIVRIMTVKPEGGKIMPAQSFICGYRVEKDSCLV